MDPESTNSYLAFKNGFFSGGGGGVKPTMNWHIICYVRGQTCLKAGCNNNNATTWWTIKQ